MQKNEEWCGDVQKNNVLDAVVNLCLKDYCNSKSLTSCIVAYSDAHKTQKLGPGYFLGNFTFTQLTTPAPTTTTTTTTPISTQSSLNPENSNGGNSQNGKENDPSSNNSANSKMIPFIFFFGIFIFAYLM
uniref:Uncharacterized protein n=1 Tax=Panagrolaimus sp. PS1159 TaxID=55785 RepID=A0AC35FLT2_9BILA